MRARAAALALLVAGSAAGEPTILPEARSRFRAGVALMSDPDGARVEEAYRLFKEAYAISPSWKILGNLGTSAMRLERHGEAIDALSRYLAEGGAEVVPVERAQVERDLRTLRAGSAVLSITVPDGEGALLVEDARARVDGGRVSNAYALPRRGITRLIVALGKHRLSTTLDGRAASWEGEVGTSGAEVRFVVEPREERREVAPAESAPSPPPHRPRDTTRRTVSLAAIGVGGAMMTAGVVTALIGQRRKIALDDACPDKTCPEERRGDVDELRRWATVTNVLLIGGGLVAAGGMTTLALDAGRTTTVTWAPTSVTLRRAF